jgi:type III secretion apparatus needle protein
MATAVDLYNGSIQSASDPTAGNPTYSFSPAAYVNRNGFDLIWSQQQLQAQMGAVEEDIRDIEQNANLSDTEKMFSMQMAMNTWSAVSNLRTNMLKSVSDTLKSIARNIS